MAILAVATSVADIVSGAPDVYTGSAKAALCLEAIQTNSLATECVIWDGEETDIWLAFTLSVEGAGSTGTHPLIVETSTGRAIFAVNQFSSGTNLSFGYYNNAGAFVQVGSATGNIGANTPARFDAHVRTIAGQLLWEVYRDGVLFASTTSGLDHFEDVNITSIETQRRGTTTAAIGRVSGVIIATESTIGVSVKQRKPTGAGALSDWEGSYSDIDETGLNTTDFVSSDVATARSTYAQGNLSDISGMAIVAVVHNIVAMRTSPATAGVKTTIRVGSDNIDSDTVVPPEFWGKLRTVFTENPLTGQPFAVSDLNTSQVGLLATG